MFRFLQKRRGSKAKPRTARTSRPTRAFRPRLEALEDRLTPSTTVFGVDTDGDGIMDRVQINGDAGVNQVAVTQNDALNLLRVTAEGINYDFTSSNIRTVIAQLGDSNDQLTYNLVADLTFQKSITASLGQGNDSFSQWSDYAPGVYAAVRAPLALTISGHTGDDFVQTSFGNVIDTNLTVIANLGDTGLNWDRFITYWFGDLMGTAQVDFNINGAAGRDRLWLFFTSDLANGDGSGIDIGPAAWLNLNLRGSSGDDSIQVEWAGVLSGLLTIDARAGQGNDTLDYDFEMRGFFSSGNLVYAFRGDEDNDTVRGTFWFYAGRSASVSGLVDGGHDPRRLPEPPGWPVPTSEFDSYYHEGNWVPSIRNMELISAPLVMWP